MFDNRIVSQSKFTQYPKADRNSELQQLSIAAFSSALLVDRFVFRSEQNIDAGVDGSIELKADERYLNLRAQVQLKGTDSTDTNRDGSISVPVKVSSLRYLLNGSSPIYVLFVAPRNELRYAWARDEQKRLADKNSNWEEQEQVSIKFTSVLDTPGLEEIYERVLEEAQLQARVADVLSAASSLDSVAINIDRATLEVTDAEKAKQILLESGTLIVTAGYPERVERLAGLLDPQTARLSRILLVRAYAEHVSGRYVSALAFLREAQANVRDLSADDQQFLEFMKDACDYQMGQLSLAEFAARIALHQSNTNSRFGLSYRINQLRQEMLSSRDINVRQQRLDELRSVLAEIIEADNNSTVFKLYARAICLEAEGQELTLRFSLESNEAAIKWRLGRPDTLPALAQDYVERFRTWEESVQNLEKEVRTVGHALVLSDTILIRLSVTYFSLLHQHRLGRMLGLEVTVREENFQPLIDQLNAVIQTAMAANRYETELRARMLLADYLELIGRKPEALSLAQEVKVKAAALNYAIPLARAEEHLAGKGPLSASDSVMAPRSEEDKIVDNAGRTDETVRAYALQGLSLYDLPNDRLPALEREYFSLRDAATDRLHWCRHLDRLCDDRHMRSQSTMYKRDPDRICVCLLHGFRSHVPNPEWGIISAAFKKAYCESCKDRNPLQSLT